MQPLGSSGNNNQLGKCSETSSKCVIWDGPDINCLGVNLCKGQSIEVVVYHTAKALCDLLDMLNIDMIDLECLTPPAGGTAPQNIQELTQVIITKLCELNQDVIDLQNTGSIPVYVPLPDCDAIIANCPANVTTQYTDSQGNLVTSLLLISADGQTSPAVEYFAGLICDLLCRMTTAESEIADLRDDVDALINQAAGALPSVVVPDCINNNTAPQQMVDPNDPTVGAIPDMATLLCDIKEALVNGNPISTLTSYDVNINAACNTTIDTETPLGLYPAMSPPPATLADLGAIANASTVQEVLTNMWVAICDLRNFANIVKSTCCPSLCAAVTWDVAAGLPPSSGGSRETLRVILAGYFTDWYGATIQANSSIPTPPGFGAGPLTTYDGNYPYTITITDASANSAIFTDSPVSDLFTSGNYKELTNLLTTSGLNPLDNWALNMSGYIIAPDYSVCNYSLDLVIPAICDIQPLAGLSTVAVGFDGVTLQYTVPIAPWPAGGTVPEYFEIAVYDSATPLGGTPLATGTIDYALYPNNYLYIYSSTDNVLPDPAECASGCPNYFETDVILPNQSYYIAVRILYNCGASSWSTVTPFTTYVPVEITIQESIQDVCVVSGDFTLSTTAVAGDLSPNFTDAISFIANQPTTVTVFAKAGTSFGFTLNTPYIIDTLASTTECPAIAGVRCWGPPSLYKYQSGGVGGSYFTGLENSYTKEGCYDYIDCKLTGDLSYLTYAGATSVDNIVNGGGADAQPGNGIATLDNSTSAPGYNPLTIPVGYDPNVDPFPIQINVNPLLHSLNGGANPNLKVIIKDTSGYLSTDSLIYFPAPNLGNTVGVPTGTPITLTYNTKTLSWGVGSYLTAQSRPTTYTSNFTDNSPLTPALGPVGVPVFLKIIIQKWNGTTYITPANSVYYVTADWLNAGLSNIGTTGFTMTGIGLQLRDKITIEWSSGVENNNQNPDYPPSSSGPGVNNPSYGKVTITQDPYPGLIGPLVACDTKTNPEYDLCKVGVPVFGAGCFLWGNTTYYPAAALNSSTNKIIEFVVTGDTTIEWEISGSSLSC
jgi:hypothetical protein